MQIFDLDQLIIHVEHNIYATDEIQRSSCEIQHVLLYYFILLQSGVTEAYFIDLRSSFLL